MQPRTLLHEARELGQLVRLGTGIGRFRCPAVGVVERPLPDLLTRVINRAVPGDCQEPRPEPVGLSQAGQCRDHPGEDVLGEVGRRFPVAHAGRHDVMDRADVSTVEHRERIRVAGDGLRDQSGVGNLGAAHRLAA